MSLAQPASNPRLLLPSGVSDAGITADVAWPILEKRRWTKWWIAIVFTLPFVAATLAGLVGLFWEGVGLWGINTTNVWGIAIANYVWWIGIGNAGTLISGLLLLTRQGWRASINRFAEAMTLFAVSIAGIFPIIHLGRPQYFYWLAPYPNTMTLWPQFRSPLLWDFWALLTYVFSSVLFWYMGLIPDLASVRDRATTRTRQRLYGIFACGFRGSSRQWRHHRAIYGVMAAVMAPVVVSIHSIVGLDFAGAATTGWHSTEFPPFFVFGALLSGFAIVLLLVIPLRRLLALGDIMTGRHLDVLCKLLLMSSLLLAYAYLMDAFTTFYGGDRAERVMFMVRVSGAYMPVYWGAIVFNCVLPQLLWVRRLRSCVPVIVLLCLGVVVGMWLERYEIVVTSLHRPPLPTSWGNYHGTFWDWATLLGTVGLFLSGILLSVRFVPVVSLHEMRALIERENADRSRAGQS